MKHRASDPLMRLKVFGPIEACSFSGENVLPRGRKAQAILCYLALSNEAAVSRQRLVGLLWSTRWPEQGRASLRQSLHELRQALRAADGTLLRIGRDRVALTRERVWIDGLSARNDSPPDSSARTPPLERLMETLTGLDPCFDEWIAVVHGSLSDEACGTSTDARSPTPPPAPASLPRPLEAPGNEPRLAAGGVLLSVLPILQVGSAEMEDYFAPALTQELVTGLARLRWLFVRFSTSAAGADYLLEGYVNRTAEGLRLVVRLIDHRDRGVILWTGTEQLGCPLQPGAIDRVVESVVEQLDPEILAIETRKALRRPATSQDGYECLLRAIPLLYRFEQRAWRNATELLEQACATDAQHGRAFAFSALCRVTGLAQGWSDDVRGDMLHADEAAAHAIACDPRDSLALALSGHIKSFIHHDFDAALALFERAIRANPSCGLSWGYSSLTYAYLGHTEEAARRLSRAQAIMIHDPYVSFIDSFRAVIAFFSRDWPSAIDACRRHLDLRPGFVAMRKLLVGALCHSGRFEEAGGEYRMLLDQEPAFSWAAHLRVYPFGRTEDRIALERAVARAGLLDTANAQLPILARQAACTRARASAPLNGRVNFQQGEGS